MFMELCSDGNQDKMYGEIFALCWNYVLSKGPGYSLHTAHYTTILINVINVFSFFRLLKDFINFHLGYKF